MFLSAAGIEFRPHDLPVGLIAADRRFPVGHRIAPIGSAVLQVGFDLANLAEHLGTALLVSVLAGAIMLANSIRYARAERRFDDMWGNAHVWRTYGKNLEQLYE